ncbi:MAG: TonB-dependent receptor [Steroidobacteraceae bacterium]
MTRSRKRKLQRAKVALASMPIASGFLAASQAAMAQDEAATSGGLEEVVVTAQKRSENLQQVPLSIQAIGTEKLDQLNITSFTDYAKFLPSVAYTSIGPGQSAVYMRGVASGENNNHSGPLPSVGIYLDEQPITTIQGSLDIHPYDIARVESLAGPQGTLYGASSQSGTIRIITNKPSTEYVDGGYGVELNQYTGHGAGYIAEGFVNLPINDKAAVRLVGWAKRDGGYISNLAGTRNYESGAVEDTTPFAGKDLNEVDTYGARAALGIHLNESWTVTPTLMAQQQKYDGSFSNDLTKGDFATQHSRAEFYKDKWWQGAMTVEGRIGNFDVVYAGAYLKRDATGLTDYADYTYWYDQYYASFGTGACFSCYFYDNAGDPVANPSQYFRSNDRYNKISHEVRLSTPKENRVRAVFGYFWQRQVHNIEQRYMVDGIADAITVTGWPDTIWLTEQQRVDRDKALFTEVSFDMTDKLSGTVGVRFFEANNTLHGFFGYSSGFSSRTGEAACVTPVVAGSGVNGGPCINLYALSDPTGATPKGVKESGNTPKFNLTYKFDPDRMVYATYSRGFRPGGVNRRGDFESYRADFLKNYELGWKTSWADNRIRLNGAIYKEDWNDIQFSFIPPGGSGLTVIGNAGKAEVKGIEASLDWRPNESLLLSLGAAYNDAKLKENYPPGSTAANGDVQAPNGTQLPVTPKFKGNLIARYNFPLGAYDAHVQGALSTQSSSWSDLRDSDRAVLGQNDSYSIADFTFGIEKDRYAIELFVNNAFDERAVVTTFVGCETSVCGPEPYITAVTPRKVGIKFSQKFR